MYREGRKDRYRAVSQYSAQAALICLLFRIQRSSERQCKKTRDLRLSIADVIVASERSPDEAQHNPGLTAQWMLVRTSL